MVSRGQIGNSMRELRRASENMTQAELAARIGVTRQTVIAIEHGRYSPSLETAFRIAQVFGKPLTSVFSYAPGSPGQGTG